MNTACCLTPGVCYAASAVIDFNFFNPGVVLIAVASAGVSVLIDVVGRPRV